MIRIGNKIVAGSADVDLSTVLKALNKTGLSIWIGTQTEHDALSDTVKNNEKTTFITYDTDEDVYLIIDTIISYGKTWSSVKISSELAKKINASDVYTKEQVDDIINAKLASALKYRGAVNTTALLPASAENGDTYFVKADGFMYAYNSTSSAWDALGTVADMTNYFTKAEITAMLQDKADKFQYDVLPTPSSETVGLLLQYTGADTQDYKNGYFYKGIDNGDSTYSWALHNVGDYYTKSETAIKYNYTMTGTASVEDDIKTFVTALIALGANTYVGFFNRSGSLGTAGNYSITVYAEEGTSAFASGYIILGAGALGKTQYTVSYYKPIGSSEEWTIKKLATIDNIYKTISTGSLTSAGTYHWFIADNLYPSTALQTATYIINGRNGGCYIMSCGTTDDIRKVTPTITTISSGSGPLVGFNYDLATGQVELQSNQYNSLFITQISGVRNDFTIENETNTPQLSTAGVIESIATKSDLPTAGVGTGINKQDIVSGDANTTINIPAYHFCSGLMYLQINGIGTALLSYEIDYVRNLNLKVIAGFGVTLTGLALYKAEALLGTFSASGDYITYAAQYSTIIRTNYASL